MERVAATRQKERGGGRGRGNSGGREAGDGDGRVVIDPRSSPTYLLVCSRLTAC